MSDTHARHGLSARQRIARGGPAVIKPRGGEPR
jgi:hypothetical protein